jgi:hypothetical protein
MSGEWTDIMIGKIFTLHNYESIPRLVWVLSAEMTQAAVRSDQSAMTYQLARLALTSCSDWMRETSEGPDTQEQGVEGV